MIFRPTVIVALDTPASRHDASSERASKRHGSGSSLVLGKRLLGSLPEADRAAIVGRSRPAPRPENLLYAVMTAEIISCLWTDPPYRYLPLWAELSFQRTRAFRRVFGECRLRRR
jgi:hypothetical protein